MIKVCYTSTQNCHVKTFASIVEYNGNGIRHYKNPYKEDCIGDTLLLLIYQTSSSKCVKELLQVANSYVLLGLKHNLIKLDLDFELGEHNYVDKSVRDHGGFQAAMKLLIGKIIKSPTPLNTIELDAPIKGALVESAETIELAEPVENLTDSINPEQIEQMLYETGRMFMDFDTLQQALIGCVKYCNNITLKYGTKISIIEISKKIAFSIAFLRDSMEIFEVDHKKMSIVYQIYLVKDKSHQINNVFIIDSPRYELYKMLTT